MVGPSGEMFVHTPCDPLDVSPCEERINKTVAERRNLLVRKAQPAPVVLIVRIWLMRQCCAGEFPRPLWVAFQYNALFGCD